MKKKIKKLLKSVSISILMFLVSMFNGPNSVLAESVSDSFADTSKINTGASSQYQVVDGQSKLSNLPKTAWWKMDDESNVAAVDSSGNGNNGSTQLSATGGTISYADGYTIHTFTSSGTLTVIDAVTAQTLVVAGGGGGGISNGAGGGGGGVITEASHALAAGNYTVTVGNGGGRTGNHGANGENSVFDTATAIGGGGGGYALSAGYNGGSGGGGGSERAGGTGTAGQGNNGGSAVGSYFGGGGGGGAGGVGGPTTGTGQHYGGAGGAGISSSISGSAVYYGGGGSGWGDGGSNAPGAGGTAVGLSGAANTGAGAGAQSATTYTGGSGIVIIRYQSDPPRSAGPAIAIGGDIVYSGGYVIHTFKSSGTFQVVSGNFNVETLVVAGGGGGGMDMAGGGGGGGVIYNSGYAVSPQSYTVTVGLGGAGAPAAGTSGQPSAHQFTIPAQNGQNSVFDTLTAIGGGRGGSSVNTYTPGSAGAVGGSGGGASGYNNQPVALGTVTGGAGTAGQGYAGGNQGNQYYSGGGGGAGGVGASGNNQANGGVGYLSAINGTSLYWGGGGGGSGYTVCGGNGGAGGGGGGAVCNTTGGSGLNYGSPGGGGTTVAQTNKPGGNGGANTGGGGGGGSHYNSNNKGGDGGSGIVIIRYQAPPPTDSATGGNITYAGGYTIHTFLASGTFTPSFDMTVDYLILGGGGGGGQAEQNVGGDGGGGGGAGGVVYSTSQSVTAGAKTITVGGGGAGSTTFATKGESGGNSVFDTVTAYGGGGGGSDSGGNNPGVNGGSGGGAANQYEGANSGGTATPPGQGNNGGNASTSYTTQRGGSGGGGAGSAGTTRTSAAGGAGGNGASYSISGSAVTYAGGGGGGASNGAAAGSAGTGGGGAGGSTSNGNIGTANTGGGGGGGGANSTNQVYGGNGGSGIVIIRYPTTVVPGQYGKARSFNGSSDYVSVMDSASLDLTGDFTVEAWVNRTGAGNSYVVSKVAGSPPSGGGYGMLVGNSGEVYCRTSDGAGFTDSYSLGGYATSESGWTHLAIVRTGSSCRVWVNAVDVTSSAGTHATVTANTANLTIGKRPDGGEYWAGKIDDVRIYQMALNEGQITGDMNNSVNYYVSGTLVSTNLLSGIAEIDGIDEFVYNLSSLPAETTTTVQFSQNGSSWYNSLNVLDGTDTLTTGADNTINIHALGWSGGNFYYKIAFSGSGGVTPVLDDINVNYTVSGYTNTSTGVTDTYDDSSKINTSSSSNQSVSGSQLKISSVTPNVAWWKMDEASGTSLADSSGSSNTGTALSKSVGWWKMDEASGTDVADYWATTNGTATGTTVVAGQYSNARNFNGTSDWVNLGVNKVGPLINGASQVTVSVWVKPSAFPAVSGSKRVFSVNIDDVAAPSGLLVRLYNDAGTIKAEVGGRSAVADAYQNSRVNYTGALNEWHHIAGVLNFATDTITTYYDGTPGTPTSVTFANTTYTQGAYSANWQDTIGNSRNNTTNVDYFSGAIDNAMIYNYGRSQAEIQADMNNVSGPSVVAGQYGNARSFNGSRDYILSSTSHNFTSEAFSLEMWINPSSMANTPVLFSNGQFQASGYYAHLRSDGGITFRTNQAAANQDTTTAAGTFTTGSWQHLAIVRNGSSVRIYKNGVDVTSSAGTHINPTTTALPFTLGTYGPSPTGWYYTGLVDDLRVYNSARTLAEIQLDMNNVSYLASATIISTNLLTGIANIQSINSFVYSMTSLPAGTSATVQFSQDGVVWYNSSGVSGGTNSLSAGVNSISLSGLAWSNSYFFYKITYTSDGNETPSLDYITVNYSTSTSTIGSTWAACKPLPGGSLTITSNCYFPNAFLINPESNVDGVDDGDLTIQSYKTLTIKGDQQIVRNEGKGIAIQAGGSIALNDLPLGAIGGNVRDYSGTGNDGSAVGSTIVAGKYDKARNFNGTSDWVDLDFGTVGASLNTASAITFEGWISPSSLPAVGERKRVISVNLAAEVGAGSGFVLALYNDGGTVKVEAGGRSVNTDSYQTARETWSGGTGTWHHIAGVINYGSDTITIYIDGVAGTSTPVTFGNTSFTQATPTEGYEDTVGAYRNNSTTQDFWPGLLDDIRVYNYGLNVDQIKDDMNYGSLNKAAPVAWYRFEDGGQLKQTNLWVLDNDGNGWSLKAETRQKARANSPGTGWVRRNTTIGSEFGDARDGNITFATNTDLNTWNHDGRTCADGGDAVNYSVTALGSTTLANGSSVSTATLSSSVSTGCLLAGDSVLAINLQGTTSASGNTGNYEALKVYSVSSNTVTFTSAKKKYYGDGATDDVNIGTATTNQRVMLQRIPQYGNVTVNTGVIVTGAAWNGAKGGVVAFKTLGTLTVEGTIRADYLGYRGGDTAMQNGESFDGYNSGYGTGCGGANNTTAAGAACSRGGGGGGSGGGGGGYGGGGAGGGGGSGCGGYGAGAGGNGGATGIRGGGGGGGGGTTVCSGGVGGNAGSNGTAGSGGTPGLGGPVAATDPSTGQGGGTSTRNYGGGAAGGTYGVANLSKLFFGSAGGANPQADNGKTGAGIVLIQAGTINIGAGVITSDGLIAKAGNTGTGGVGSGGIGGSAGGSILLKGNSVTVGTAKITANLSAGAAGGYNAGSACGGGGGGGGEGRIAIGAVTVSGTTTPTYTAVTAP